MNIEKLRPIPKDIEKRIRETDYKDWYAMSGTRIYSYLTTVGKEVVKVTVAAKMYEEQLLLKQVAVHGVDSPECWVRDMEYIYFGMGYRYGFFDKGIGNRRKAIENGKWYSADTKYYNVPSRLVNIAYLGTTKRYKYCGYKYFRGSDIIKYLRVYKQYPQTEYLLKNGLQHLAYRVSIVRKMAKDKNFCNWILQNNQDIHDNYYSSATVLKAYKQHISPQAERQKTAIWDDLLHFGICDQLKQHLQQLDVVRFDKYLTEQHTDARSYSDYYSACVDLGLDMQEVKNLYPNDFKRWHDIRIDEYHSKQAELNAEKRKKLYEQFASIANKYAPLTKKDEVYIVMIAQSPAELTLEGEALHHCVGKMGYDQKFANEKSLIFFVRLVAQPDVPLATLEYSLQDKKILQCYGDNDSKPQDELLNFVNKNWLPYANKKLRKIQKAA